MRQKSLRRSVTEGATPAGSTVRGGPCLKCHGPVKVTSHLRVLDQGLSGRSGENL
jgi:hypothetical protein